MTWHATVSFPVQWGEMDALGHVNHARFLTWLESARIALLVELGLLTAAHPATGPVLATITCDYLRPIVYPATVVVGVRVSAAGRTSITMEYSVWSPEAPDTPSARASSVVVIVDYATMAKVPLSDEVRAKIAAL
jgi:acyl-CoA thioester hydrolase